MNGQADADQVNDHGGIEDSETDQIINGFQFYFIPVPGGIADQQSRGDNAEQDSRQQSFLLLPGPQHGGACEDCEGHTQVKPGSIFIFIKKFSL